ncbi:biotin carboxylase [Allocatelliglobosispora scoriae]|uniref:Biotin carboxylase n=1 Tax=Allocatelliglobosispora scoriae TaxID=643052 RepID=A0A841BK96_9ACTN|nr:ATP-grasp domain-containing protein [Allocatelliglobosispora scoriae]MBB5867182.1 biotin carboxylase [Allocatelliglobosispora scoriae]
MPVRVVVLGGRANILEGTHGLGLDTVLIHREGGYEPRAAQLTERIVHADLGDYALLEKIVRDLHAERPFARVLSLTEDCLVPAAQLNEALGLGGNSVASVRLLKDKVAMRGHLAERGISPVRWRVVDGLDATVRFLGEVGDRIIIKPVDGAGSESVFPIAGEQEARAAWELLGERPMLAEEFLRGTELSVETFSHAGRHVVITSTDKVLSPGLVEIGHTIPSRVDLDGTGIADLVHRFLDAVGIVEGPAHTEVILGPAGPRIVESHNRIGGGSLRELIQLAYGIDLARWAASVPLGLEPGPAEPPAMRHGAAVRFLTARPGIIQRFDGVAEAAADSDITVHLTAKPGDRATPLRSSHDRTIGFVIGRGVDAADAAARCEAARDRIDVVTAAD